MPLYNNGQAAPNEYSKELPEEFVQWCDGVCFPTTQFEVSNARSSKGLGYAYVWKKNFINGNNGESLCFSEFIIFELTGGEIYIAGQDGRTCGAYIDDNIITPVSDPDARVLAGGGDGKIVKATRRYKRF